MKTYIVNPDNNKLVSIEDWRKEADPTRAILLAVETDDDHLLLVSKSYLPKELDFEDAQKACAEFKPMEGITFRCPLRKETIDLYDARFQGLDEAVKLTGGNFACNPDGNWYWTAERDTDPRCSASSAWCSGGYYGYMYGNLVSSSSLALPVTLLK